MDTGTSVLDINKTDFSRMLLGWYDPETRPMPWKGEKDPYRIWISEVILQQTRVEQGWLYYERFIERFPDVSALASAHIDEVLKLWQGLGYYSRARNLHKGARQIMEIFGGKIPEELDRIRSLSSVGPYTAAAIASFAYNAPHAVVDGNVIRVLARIFGVEVPFDTGTGQKIFQNLASSLLDTANPAIYNQAIMDLGATVCLPVKPVCHICPFNVNCIANATNSIDMLPVKSKITKKRIRHFNYFVFSCGAEILIFRRHTGDIYEGMYEFYLRETDSPLSKELASDIVKTLTGKQYQFSQTIIPKPHILTHQRLYISYHEIELERKNEINLQGEWIHFEVLGNLPVPKFIHDYIKKLRG